MRSFLHRSVYQRRQLAERWQSRWSHSRSKFELSLVLVFACGVALACSAVLQACSEADKAPEVALSDLLLHYLKVQEALAADDFAAAKQALAMLGGATQGEVEEWATAAASAADIDAVRQAFKPLSESFINVVLPAGYGVVYCPMADEDRGAKWIQKKGEIANPYFGSRMLRCGAFVESEG